MRVASMVLLLVVFTLLQLIHTEVNGQCDGTYTKYVNAMPVPPVISLKNGASVDITISQFTQKVHRDLPPTTLWGYQQTYPGPTIEVNSGDTVHVRWINKLPAKPLINIPNATATVVHLHGGHVPPESDGYPTNYWFPGQNHTDTYPNLQNATMLWYHDHTTMNTRVNVYLGMAGTYIIRDAYERSLKLPSGKYEIPIIIQDRNFDAKGQLQYPVDFPPDPNYVGETILANGMVWPFVSVEPTTYRIRFLNGANNRFFNLSLSNGASFTQIGGDQGFLPRPVSLTWVLLSSAERADVLIDFSRFKNQKIFLTNSAASPNYPGGNPPNPCTDGAVLQFVVSSSSTCGDCNVQLPVVLVPRPNLSSRVVSVVRNLTLDSMYGGFVLDGKSFDDPISEFPVLGQTEIWNFVSNTFMSHPIHLHLAHFYVLNRQNINRRLYRSTGMIEYTGNPTPPRPNELGPKDTVVVEPQGVTSVMVQFTDYPGLYVWHCHMLEHEDYMMMRPFQVVKK